MVTLEGVLWYLFLVDAIFANVIMVFWKKEYSKIGLSRFIPLKPVWTILYLFLVLWIGSALYRLGLLI